MSGGIRKVDCGAAAEPTSAESHDGVKAMGVRLTSALHLTSLSAK